MVIVKAWYGSVIMERINHAPVPHERGPQQGCHCCINHLVPPLLGPMTPTSTSVSLRSLRWIFAVCTITACSNSGNTSVQTPAPSTNAHTCLAGPPSIPNVLITEMPNTPFTICPEPPLPLLPQAGAKATDPTFGTTILRLTDGADDNSDMQVQYSYWPVFNRNNTFIHVKGTYSGSSRSVFFTFDPATVTAGSPVVLQ